MFKCYQNDLLCFIAKTEAELNKARESMRFSQVEEVKDAPFEIVEGQYVLGDDLLNTLKSDKKKEIKAEFSNEADNYLIATSSIDNFVIDARRVDKLNIDSLIQIYKNPVTYKGHTDIRENTTKEELEIFRDEMIKAGHSLYQKKWMLEVQIDKCTTKEEVEAIKW